MNMVDLKAQIKRLIIEELDLRNRTEADIPDDIALFGGGLALDSLDALQLAMALEQRFKVAVPEGEEGRKVFASVNAIASHIQRALGS